MKNNKIGFWDIGLTKFSVFFMTLFLISIWPAFTYWVMSIHWFWFLALSLLLAIKPLLAFFKKE